MIKLKYTIDKESLIENADYDLSEFEHIEVSIDTSGRLSIILVNDKIVVDNKVLVVDENQKVADNVSKYK